MSIISRSGKGVNRRIVVACDRCGKQVTFTKGSTSRRMYAPGWIRTPGPGKAEDICPDCQYYSPDLEAENETTDL